MMAPAPLRSLSLLALIALAACASRLPPEASRDAVAALAEARFEDAERAARAVLAKDKRHSRARVVLAKSRYQAAMHQFTNDIFSLGAMMFGGGQLNHRYYRFSFEETIKALAEVEEDLAVAADDPDFGLELCLACWKHD